MTNLISKKIICFKHANKLLKLLMHFIEFYRKILSENSNFKFKVLNVYSIVISLFRYRLINICFISSSNWIKIDLEFYLRWPTLHRLKLHIISLTRKEINKKKNCHKKTLLLIYITSRNTIPIIILVGMKHII